MRYAVMPYNAYAAERREAPTGDAVRRIDHPLRFVLAAELHARPVSSVRAPLRGSHLAMLTGERGFDADFAHLVELCRYHQVPIPEPAKHYSADFGSYSLKWERHGEFTTYTFFRHGAFIDPFDNSVLSLAPQDWLDSLPGQRLAAVHLALEPCGTKRTPEDLAQYFDADSLTGSLVSGGAATVWTDFRIYPDDFSRILISDARLRPRQAGRTIQRLLEIDTYRMLALLALPLAQSLSSRIAGIEIEMSEITRRLAEIEGLNEPRDMLARLSKLWVEVEAMTGDTRFRLDATRAYYELVQQRTQRLREQRIEGIQTIDEFLQRRLAPAMTTCHAIGQRVHGLAQRLARTSGLLSTQVNVALEGQNVDLLASMDRRAGMQARLQRTLELISICALTYYLSALFGLALRALNHFGFGADVELLTGASIPVMFALGWIGLRWARRSIAKADLSR